jgi:RimJ/RimL family protein N-acetyltransferase
MILTPLAVDDAGEMVGVLADRDLYEFTGGEPPSRTEIESLYRAQIEGPDRPDETWHNWILRFSDEAVGFVQATVIGDAAEVAWVVGKQWQGQGLATEAAIEMCRWLTESGVVDVTAHIHPEHIASQRVAMGIGLRETAEIDADGEVVWASP